VEQVVGSWRNLVAARSAYRRIHDLLAVTPVRDPNFELPRPTGLLTVENLSFAPPGGGAKLILKGVSFRLEPGEVLGIIGPSGAGKSTLVRQIVGVMSPSNGAVRLDGSDVSTWPKESLGRYVGYLPQDIELFADTVAANISRFQLGVDVEVINAAQMAGVHDMIVRLPNGYDTQAGDGGAVLSGGYRQRVGLARAVYGRPSLIVLDEPSSNLDADGDAALADCIVQLKALGTTVVIVSHRPATMGIVDKILVLKDGVAEMFGTRTEVMSRLTRAVPMHAVQSTAS
jgi:ATP-binding cassette subfamily C protein